MAFYALPAHESALEAMGDDKLKVIAAELMTHVRKGPGSVTDLLTTAK